MQIIKNFDWILILQNSTYFSGSIIVLCLGRIILAINVFNFTDFKTLLAKHSLYEDF